MDAAQGNLFLAYEGQLDELSDLDDVLAKRCTMLGIFPEEHSSKTPHRIYVRPARLLNGSSSENCSKRSGDDSMYGSAAK